MSLHILFMGTPDFAAPTLHSLISTFNDAKLSVISMPDKVRGRGKKTTPSPVKSVALAHQLPVYTPYTKFDLTQQINDLNPDLIIVVAYGMIIEKTIVDRYFCVNSHASLLPDYRGASPIQASLLNGDTKTGITLIKLNELMDAGDILYSRGLSINETDNHGSLTQSLSKLGAESVVHFIQSQFIPNQIRQTPQDDSKATYCKKIKKEDLLVDSSMNATDIYRKIKAFSPKPGAYCIQESKRVKLLAANLTNGELQLVTVQPEGKAPMPYSDYLLGYPKGVDING
jgi:methionyl-tRNA formyltransferase